MPRATIVTEPQRKDLDTVPGGYIVARPLTYGQALRRREMAMDIAAQGLGGDTRRSDVKLDLAIVQRAVVAWDFQHCIVEHNLTDDNDRPINFKDPNVIDILDPRVGGEIEAFLDGMNNYEGEEEDHNMDFSGPRSEGP